MIRIFRTMMYLVKSAASVNRLIFNSARFFFFIGLSCAMLFKSLHKSCIINPLHHLISKLHESSGLARIFHEKSIPMMDLLNSTALYSKNVLNVLSSTISLIFLHMPCRMRTHGFFNGKSFIDSQHKIVLNFCFSASIHFHHLITKSHESSGLETISFNFDPPMTFG